MVEILALCSKERAEELKNIFSQRGYNIIPVSGWEEALDSLEENTLTLYLIQQFPVLGPMSNIAERLKELRQLQNLPALLMVPRDSLKSGDMLWGFNDFVMEPFRPQELLCRVGRLLSNPTGESKNPLVAGDLVIDSEKYQVFISGRPIVLTYKEFQLLKCLVNNRGRVFSRETLLNQVWGYDYFGGDRTVDVHIRRLRSKIEDSTHAFIETVRNVGYRFIV